jgi:NAD(P)-dependent dehydrogenase (short-subunit alcohol dehydrogenase family)
MTSSPSTKIAFITGANRGIGFETARELGQHGITVILGVRDIAKGQKAVETLKAENIKAEAILFDAAKPNTFQTIYDYIKNTYGHLDILVNNAGILHKEESLGNNSTLTLSLDALKTTFDTNFFSVVALTQTLLPLLQKSPAGRIVNLSSILGSLTLHSQPDSPIATAKAFAYNASKTALNAFTVHLADALRDTPIKVNSAHPGWVQTEMGGAEAPLSITDGAKTSVHLSTLDAKGPTGRFIHLNDTLPW